MERGGNVLTVVVEKTGGATILPIVEVAADSRARIVTDEHGAYNGLTKALRARHRKPRRGAVDQRAHHTQNIEGFRNQMNRRIDGTHHHVSEQHMQKFAGEYAFRFNRPPSEKPMFAHLA